MNADAPRNIASKLVTLATFHADISVLNNPFPIKTFDMSVMAETSHVPMAGEQAPTGEAVRHVFTSATRSAFVVYTGTGGGGGGDHGGGGGLNGGGGGGGLNGGGGGGDGGDGDGDGGGGGLNGGGGGERAVHTDPLDPVNTRYVEVRSALFESQEGEQRTLLNDVAPPNISEKSLPLATFHTDRS